MKNYPESIKAEVLISLDYATDHELSETQVFYVSKFRKKHQGDIMRAELAKTGDKRKISNYYINRDGFYDRLPEGLFHGGRSSKWIPGTEADSRTLYEKQQQEKAWSRKFFQPFENFLFEVNLKTEKLFAQWLKDADRALGDFFLYDKIFQQLSEPMRKSVFSMLASFPSIKGNEKRIAYFLSAVFETEVEVNREEGFETFHAGESGNINRLGQTTLGFDTVCGDRIMEHVQKWKFVIKSSPDKIAKHIDQRETKTIFDIINRFFIPVGVFAEFYVVAKEKLELTLFNKSVAGGNQYLGYNVCI